MGKVIAIQFITLDGVVDDPDGRAGTPHGGWAFRFGPEAVAGDKFKLGSILDTGVLLLGRSTWDGFSRLWPNRADDFAAAMNRIPKVVVTRSTPELNAWPNSTLVDGDLLDAVARLAHDRDVVVVGSTSVVRALAEADAIDEYRMLVFPTAVGTGDRLFVAPVDLALRSVEQAGPAVLLQYERPRP